MRKKETVKVKLSSEKNSWRCFSWMVVQVSGECLQLEMNKDYNTNREKYC